MKRKPGAGELQPLVDLGEEQGYLTFEQINNLLPSDITSSGDLKAALRNFEDLDFRILSEVPGPGASQRAATEPEEDSADRPGEHPDPVRLYLKEMAQFKLLTREGEIQIAKRIEAGQADIVQELVKSPVMLDYIVRIGQQVEAGEADLSLILDTDDNETDEGTGPPTDQIRRERMVRVVRGLTGLRARLKKARRAADGPRRAAQDARLKQRVRDEFRRMQLSPRVEDAVIGEMKSLLEQHRAAQRTIAHYETATGRTTNQLLREAAHLNDRRHLLKINGTRENLADIAERIGAAQKQIRAIERRVESTGDELAQSLRIIEAGRAASSEAKKALTQANLRLVVSLGRRYNNRGLSFLDLIQEGSIGLMRAVDKFDYKRGYKFSTYATWWIRQSMSRAIADQSRTIRVPIHMVESTNKLLRATRFLVQRLGREPSLDEIAHELDMPPEQVQKVLRIVKEPISLETPIGEGDEGSVGDLVEDETALSPLESAIHTNLGDRTRAVLATLTPREEQILRMRFGIDQRSDCTLEEVGKLFSVTRERIRQIEAKALRKLRTASRARHLHEFLGPQTRSPKDKEPDL